MDIFKLTPACKEHSWGGYRLSHDYGKAPGYTRVAESFELSCELDSLSMIADPRFSGKTLLSYLYEQGDDVLGSNCKRFSQFPLLISLIDTGKTPSIHVHPTHKDAGKNKGEREQPEIIHIIDCAQDASLYLGLQRSMTRRELTKAIMGGETGNVLNQVMVEPGETYYIAPGTLHGIGAGILAAQVCRPGRDKYRIHACPEAQEDSPLTGAEIQHAVENADLEPGKDSTYTNPRYLHSRDYEVSIKSVNGHDIGHVGPTSFAVVLVLDGSGVLRGKNAYIPFYSTDTIFLGADSGDVIMEGICDIMVVQVPAPATQRRLQLPKIFRREPDAAAMRH